MAQSVSMASYRAHTQDYIRVARILLDAAEPLAAQPAPAGRDLLLVQRARDVAQYLIELYLRFPPDRETGLALRRYDEMLCQTYPHIAAMMTNKNTRLLRAGRYLPYRTIERMGARKTIQRRHFIMLCRILEYFAGYDKAKSERRIPYAAAKAALAPRGHMHRGPTVLPYESPQLPR